MNMADLFAGFDPEEIRRAKAQHAADKRETRRAAAQRSANRHHMRGDIDALSYVRHILAGVSHLDHLLMSTWCIAKNDLTEISAWLDAGKIEQFDLYAGEIFPGSYGDEYEQMLAMCEAYGSRLIVAKNHSKITLASNAAEAYYLTVESSANVNTNPRIEQSAIHCGRDLHTFYLEFFSGIQSIDKHSKTH